MTWLLDHLNLWYVWPIGIVLWVGLGFAEFGVIDWCPPGSISAG